jgi:hypothetical protein
MSYDLAIQPRDSKPAKPRAQVESFIESLPHVKRESEGICAYGKPSSRMFVHIYTGEEEAIDSIGVSVPAAHSGSSQKAALLLCFKIAEHLKWEVFDQQLGDYLDKKTVAEVLDSEKQFGESHEEALKHRASGKATFGEMFGDKIWEHRAIVIIPTLILAAILAGFILIKRGMAEDSFVWLFMGALAILLVTRALIAAAWHKLRS